MTETAQPPAQSPATPRVEAWLHDFEQALAAADGASAADLFVPDCFWRDLVAFTWNLKTVEGHAGVADLVDRTARHVGARGFHLSGFTTYVPGDRSSVSRDMGLTPGRRSSLRMSP